jgi:putative membrane protein
LSNTLIPHAQNAELKSVLENALKLFLDHQHHAERLAKQLNAAQG